MDAEVRTLPRSTADSGLEPLEIDLAGVQHDDEPAVGRASVLSQPA
ncbi:hypothetical protein [Streptomyces sp. NPDC017993]